LILSYQSQKFSSSTCGEVWQSKMTKKIVQNLPGEYTVCQKILYRLLLLITQCTVYSEPDEASPPAGKSVSVSRPTSIMCCQPKKKLALLRCPRFPNKLHGADCIAPLKRSLHIDLVEYCPFSVNLQWCPIAHPVYPDVTALRLEVPNIKKFTEDWNSETTANVLTCYLSRPLSQYVYSLFFWNGRKGHKEPNQQWTSLPAN
jgi:hypothetical protein